MVVPRFLDTFAPHPSIYQAAAASSDPRVGMLTSDLASVAGARDTRLNHEQTKAFTYWNYVAITAICDRVAQQFPQMGVSRRSGTSRRAQKLTQSQRSFLRQSYGGMLGAANEEFEPLAENHPLVQLLRDVNPWDTWCEFIYETVLFLELTGEFFWWIIPNGLGLPVELYVVPTQWVHEKRDRNGQLEMFRIIPDGDYSRTEEVEPDNMVHAKLKNPRSKTRGYSALQAAPYWPDNALSIETARWHGFKGINPDLVIMLEGETYKNPEESTLERIREKFRLRNAGVRKAGEPLLLPPGVKTEVVGRTNQEMAYVDSADQVRDNNLALHRTPKTIAGITADVNRASFEGSMVAFCELKVNPRLRFLAGVLQEWIASRFDRRILVWFEDTAPRNAEQELRETELDARVGAITADERRQERGRPPMGTPAYQTGWIPAGLQPLNDDMRPDPNEDPEPDPAPDGADDEEQQPAASRSKRKKATENDSDDAE